MPRSVLLAESKIAALKSPPKGRLDIKDGAPNLYVTVSHTGAKGWMVEWRWPGGKKEKLVIGQWPAMTAPAARERCREVMELVRAGVDPRSRAADEEAAAQAAEDSTVRAVADAYIAAMGAGELIGKGQRALGPGTVQGRTSQLRRLVVPALGHRQLDELTSRDIGAFLERLHRQKGPADEVLKTVRTMFGFALARGMFSGAPPTFGLKNRQPRKRTSRVLTDDEFKALWLACAQRRYPFGHCLKLLALTGQRKGEIAGARWSEVDWEKGILTVPVERVKNKLGAHEVVLSDEALAVLRDARATYDLLGYSSGLIFDSGAGTPISGWSKVLPVMHRLMRGILAGISEEERRAVRAGGALRAETLALKASGRAKIKAAESYRPWTPHDLRHSFITRCLAGEENAEGEVTWCAALDVVQSTVNHRISQGVTATYNHSDQQRQYRIRKRELARWWGRKLASIVEGRNNDNVVQLRQLSSTD